eukprot:scaffold12967_cov120-Isochrysis_galbana.AAC.1
MPRTPFRLRWPSLAGGGCTQGGAPRALSTCCTPWCSSRVWSGSGPWGARSCTGSCAWRDHDAGGISKPGCKEGRRGGGCSQPSREPKGRLRPWLQRAPKLLPPCGRPRSLGEQERRPRLGLHRHSPRRPA